MNCKNNICKVKMMRDKSYSDKMNCQDLPSCPDYIPQTNGDFIRSMSDEKLATLLCSIGWKMGEESDCLTWLKNTKEERIEL